MNSGPMSQAQENLMLEGDRLARQLAQSIHGTLHDQNRMVFLGRSLALNLVNAFIPTVEHVSRHAGTPLHASLTTDERQRPILQIVNSDGEILPPLPVDDLLQHLLYSRGRLHPTVYGHLADGVRGDEHHATRALVQCLRSKPVLDAMQRQITAMLKAGN